VPQGASSDFRGSWARIGETQSRANRNRILDILIEEI